MSIVVSLALFFYEVSMAYAIEVASHLSFAAHDNRDVLGICAFTAATAFAVTDLLPWMVADVLFAAWVFVELWEFAPGHVGIPLVLILISPPSAAIFAALVATRLEIYQCIAVWLASAARAWASSSLANMLIVSASAEITLWVTRCVPSHTPPSTLYSVASFVLGLRCGAITTEWTASGDVAWRSLPAVQTRLAYPMTAWGGARAVLTGFVPISIRDVEGVPTWHALHIPLRAAASPRRASEGPRFFCTVDPARRAFRLALSVYLATRL